MAEIKSLKYNGSDFAPASVGKAITTKYKNLTDDYKTADLDTALADLRRTEGYGITIDENSDNAINAEVEYVSTGDSDIYEYKPFRVISDDLKIDGIIYVINGKNYYNNGDHHYIWDGNTWATNNSNIHDYLYTKNGKYYKYFSYVRDGVDFIGLGVYDDSSDSWSQINLKNSDGSDFSFNGRYLNMFGYGGKSYISWVMNGHFVFYLKEIDLETGILSDATDIIKNLIHSSPQHYTPEPDTKYMFDSIRVFNGMTILTCLNISNNYSHYYHYKLNQATNEWDSIWLQPSDTNNGTNLLYNNLDDVIYYNNNYYIYAFDKGRLTRHFYIYNNSTNEWDLLNDSDKPNYLKEGSNLRYWKSSGITYYGNESYDENTDSWTYNKWADNSYTGLNASSVFHIGNVDFHVNIDNHICTYDKNTSKLNRIKYFSFGEGYYEENVDCYNILYIKDKTLIKIDGPYFDSTWDGNGIRGEMITEDEFRNGLPEDLYIDKNYIINYNDHVYMLYYDYETYKQYIYELDDSPNRWGHDSSSNKWIRHEVIDNTRDEYTQANNFIIINGTVYVSDLQYIIDLNGYSLTDNPKYDEWSNNYSIYYSDIYTYNGNTYCRGYIYEPETNDWKSVIDDSSFPFYPSYEHFSFVGKSLVSEYNGFAFELTSPGCKYITAHGDELQTKLVAGDGITIIGDTIYAIPKEVDISGKEDTSNKITTWCETPDDNHYPSEKLVKDSLTDLQNQITALMLGAKLALTVSPTYGPKNVATSYKWTATFSGATPENIKIFDNTGTQIQSTTTGTSTNITQSKTFTSNTTYTATATYQGMTFNASVTLQIRDQILYGFASKTGNPTTKYNAVGSVSGQTFSGTATGPDQYFKIYVPSGVTVPTSPKFSMGGAPASYTKGSTIINGITYTTFISDDVYTTGGHVDIDVK